MKTSLCWTDMCGDLSSSNSLPTLPSRLVLIQRHPHTVSKIFKNETYLLFISLLFNHIAHLSFLFFYVTLRQQSICIFRKFFYNLIRIDQWMHLHPPSIVAIFEEHAEATPELCRSLYSPYQNQDHPLDTSSLSFNCPRPPLPTCTVIHLPAPYRA
jgi:hypothetical protein